jgi:hypothetical protein
MSELLSLEILEELAKPFSPDVIEWKPGATNQDKTKALALAYVEVRHYIERLNEVIGPDWHDDYEFIGQTGGLVICRLTVCGITRSDIGEKGESDVNTATSAVAQSFKRACVKFGLGTHLYRMPRIWVEYNSQYKKFTPGALTSLRRLASEDGGDNGNQPPAEKPEPGDSGADYPNTGEKLLVFINSRIQVPYDNVHNLRGAIRKKSGNDEWDWPAPTDREAWREAYRVAATYANAKVAS